MASISLDRGLTCQYQQVIISNKTRESSLRWLGLYNLREYMGPLLFDYFLVESLIAAVNFWGSCILRASSMEYGDHLVAR